MISDNFKKVILLYVYYMGRIDLRYRVYLGHLSSTTLSSSQGMGVVAVAPAVQPLVIIVTTGYFSQDGPSYLMYACTIPKCIANE